MKGAHSQCGHEEAYPKCDIEKRTAMNGKKTLVTGGAGFIGSHLCRRLVHEGHRVICIDNATSGSWDNVSDLASMENFELLEANVADSASFEGIEGVERIYNLACPASPRFYQADPVGTLKTSVLGALNVLELARRAGVRVLQTSTSEVYGEPLEHPQKETYRGNVNPVGPRACYDEGKRAAETLFIDYRLQYGVDIRVVRIFNTYGPAMRSDDGRVVPNFIRQALAGQALTVYGDGMQTRSFCYVDDLVEALVRMMECEGFSGPVNLGNPGEYTMLELAQKVIELTGSTSDITFAELPCDDPTRRCPDISLAKEKLGWEPKTQLDEGLASTVEYFRGVMQ